MINDLHNIEVLLVEDTLEDANLVIRSLKKNNLGNSIIHLQDGEEALTLFSPRANMPAVLSLINLSSYCWT
jgi:two-component system response regulator